MKTKTIRHFLSHIQREYPSLGAKLSAQRDILHFQNTCLTALEREQILFIVPKNDQLLFAFKHKALCAEFNYYKHKLIIDTLKTHIQHFPSLKHIKTIRAYVPGHILTPPAPNPKSVQTFKELSHARFENLALTPSLHAKFEALRTGIQRQILKECQ